MTVISSPAATVIVVVTVAITTAAVRGVSARAISRSSRRSRRVSAAIKDPASDQATQGNWCSQTFPVPHSVHAITAVAVDTTDDATQLHSTAGNPSPTQDLGSVRGMVIISL